MICSPVQGLSVFHTQGFHQLFIPGIGNVSVCLELPYLGA